MVAAGRGGHLVNVSSAAGLVALPWHAAYSASKYGLRGLSEVLRFDLARHRIGVSVVVPGAVKTPLVNTVEIAGVDREDPTVRRWVDRFSGHAVSPERAAEKILAGVAKNRYLIYTSHDIRALYAFKRLAWWPYSVAMRQVNGYLHARAAASGAAALTRQVGWHRVPGCTGASSSRTPSSRTGRSSSKRSRMRSAAAMMTSGSVVGAVSLRILVRV